MDGHAESSQSTQQSNRRLPPFLTQGDIALHQSPGIPPYLNSPFARSASGPQIDFHAKPRYAGPRMPSGDALKRKSMSSSEIGAIQRANQSHGSKVSEMVARFDASGSQPARSLSQNANRPPSLIPSQGASRKLSYSQGQQRSHSQKHAQQRSVSQTGPLNFTTTPPSQPSKRQPLPASSTHSDPLRTHVPSSPNLNNHHRIDSQQQRHRVPSQSGSQPLRLHANGRPSIDGAVRTPSSSSSQRLPPRAPSPALSGPATPSPQKRPRTSLTSASQPEGTVAGPSRSRTQSGVGTTPIQPPPSSMKPSYSGGNITPKARQAATFQSPASARSGPESPDPLNLISPAKAAKRHRREMSPTLGRAGSQAASSQSRSQSGLEIAMGDSLRTTQIKRRAEAMSESEHEQEMEASSSSASQDLRASKMLRKKRSKGEQRKHGRVSTDGPSPIKATNFYASSSAKSPIGGGRKLNLAIADDSPVGSATEAEAVLSTSSPTALVVDEEHERGSSKSGKKTKTKPKKEVSPKKQQKDRVQHCATTFTSSLRLALPAGYESDSLEEWEREADEVRDDRSDDDDGFSFLMERRKSQQPEALQTPNAAGVAAAPKPRLSTSIIKNASRAPPIRRLLDFIEDLFEAEASLPDRDGEGEELQSPAEDFFVLVDGIAVIKPSKLQHLSRLIRICASNGSIARKAAAAPQSIAAQGEEEGQAPRAEPSSIVDIETSELQKLTRILSQTLKVGEGVNPFPSSLGIEAHTPSPKKPDLRRRRSQSSNSATTPSRARRVRSQDEEDEQMDEDEGEQEDGAEEDEVHSDAEREDEVNDLPSKRKPGRPKSKGKHKASINASSAPTNTQQEHEQMGEQLSRVATSLMGVECTLSLLTVDHIDRNLISEDLVRPCFDLLRSALEQAVYPFVEACANIGSISSNPLLEALVEAVAPSTKAKRGRPSKKNPQSSTAEQSSDPSGIFRGCGEYLASIFRQSCSAMAHAQKLVQKPSISLSESIILGAIYAGMGPFFAIEPDMLTGTSEAAKANARGRKAMETLAPGMTGGVAMKSLRLPALNLLRNVFARHPDQRQWIIEELLTSLTRLPDMKKNRRHHSLRNGKSINSITALLLQLVQTTADGDRVSPSKDGSAVGADAALEVAMAARQREEEAAHEAEEEETRSSPSGSSAARSDYDLAFSRKALEGPMQASRAIATFLMGKVSQAKVVKSSTDFSYASVIENLVSDLLTTVFLPEWPASILLLSSFCRSFSNALEDSKTSPDARGLALEHTGTIAAHLRGSQLKVDTLRPTLQSQAHGARATPHSLSLLERERDSGGLGDLNDAYLSVLNHLLAAEIDDQASLSASHFLVSQWGSELSASLVRTSATLDIAREAQDEDARAEVPIIELFLSELHQALLLVSKHAAKLKESNAAHVFDARSADSYDTVAAISEQLVHTTSFAVTFDFMRELLVSSLDSPVVGNRTKALRGLSAIYAVDSSLLSEMYVREAVETRLSDESTGVREAAVSILSKYLLGQPDDIEDIYERLRERIYDAGLAVRKRTLKLLANIYRTLESEGMRVDACVRMVRCVSDEDVGIQDIAVQTLSDIWLRVGEETSAQQENEAMSPARRHKVGDQDGTNAKRRSASKDAEMSDRDASVDDVVSIIVSVTGAIRERPSPLEEVFRRIGKDRSDAEMKQIVDRLRLISDSIIAALDEDAEGTDGATGVDSTLTLIRIRTVYLVVSTNPAVLSISKAKALLPHLKSNPNTAEEGLVFELLLKIFRVSLPLMPKTALAFANQLESTIRPWLNNPPRQMAALQELIACYTTIVRSHTENYALLIKTFGALLRALRSVANKLLQQSNAPLDWKARMIMSETALLCEKADFDSLRKEKPALAEEIDAAVGDNSKAISEVVYQMLLSIRDSSPVYAPHALRDVGFLFRGSPLLMIQDDGMQVMDAIFGAKMPSETEMLLRIILDFLTVDSEKRAPERAAAEAAVAASAAATGRRSKGRNSEASKGINIKELVGTTETYADSGVSSVLVQRYLEPILESARAVRSPSVQRPAFDILKFVVNQGLTHPLQCVPTLIALETHEDRLLASRAVQLHEHLASKHASLLASRYSELIRTSFDFQVQLFKDNLQELRGYRIDAATGYPVALLQSWYSLLRDKRQTRLDFIKAMCKLLDVDTSKGECEDAKVLLARYVADGLATLDYKTTEEVLVIAAETKKILAVTGAQVKFFAETFLSESETGMSGAGSDEEEEQVDSEMEEDESEEESPRKQRGKARSRKRNKSASMDIDDTNSEARPRKQRGNSKSKSTSKDVRPSGPSCVARMSIVMGTALLLRNHLKSLYGLSEERCNKYSASGGKKRQSTTGAGADRPPTRKDPMGRPLSFDEMPLAFDSMASRSVALQQLETYEDMVDDEGARGDDPDDWEE
ncbi:hypothetical protein BDZ90DRAFT_278424 [Jaminaea rosea]|uniref:Sister chromatid cohesion protein n=1 Tax=Jaminaea rosea TaxID=1569628 RepID=A0A316UUR9_9BASI|nr:hypothetical protein BDZ90DRAFT_278424 [Jaminaea rosea]PWN29029.1 hypothetical protein BDZ90DRAFT_278424 [Jaminaea rosea]